MQHMKPAIIDMIEQGYGNQEIAQTVECSDNYVRLVRTEYNKLVKEPKRSLHSKPKQGTKWRAVYDYFAANPNATCTEASKATGANRGSCYRLRSRYLIAPSEKPKQPKVNVVNHVTLADLELIE